MHSPMAQAGGKESGRAARGTPILALPPASQIDTAVLDALPLDVKRELERAYGAAIPQSCHAAQQCLSAGMRNACKSMCMLLHLRRPGHVFLPTLAIAGQGMLQ